MVRLIRPFSAVVSALVLESVYALEDPSVADQLRGLMSDSRFQSCEQDASSPLCQGVREEAEKKIVLAQTQIDTDLVTSRAYINSLRDELIQKVAELKKMNETLVGSMFTTGLVEQYEALTEGIAQLESVMETSNQALLDEIVKRGDLFNQEMSRISEAQSSSADSAQKAMLKLASSNLLAQTAQIRGIGNIFGRSLSDLASQSADLMASNDERLTQLNTDITQSTQASQDELAVIVEAAGVAREDAKAVAAVGNATFRNAEQNLFKSAEAQLATYKKYGDTLMLSAKQDMDQTLKDTIRDVSDKIVELRTDLVGQFSANADAVFQNITKLKDAASTIVPEALKRATDLVDRAQVKLDAAQQSATSSTESVKRMTTDTSKLLSDVSDEIKILSASQQDKQAQAAAQLDQNVDGVKSAASAQMMSMTQGVQGELTSLFSQVSKTQASATAATQQAKDSYSAQLAGIQQQAGQGSLAAVAAVSDASAASATLNRLNQAKLQRTADTHGARLAAVGNTVMDAMQEARDTTGEISSQFGQQNRQLELSSGQLVANANSQNAQTVRELTASVDSDFADVQSSISKTSQLSQQEMLDLKSALSGLSSGSDAVGSKAVALEQQLRTMTTDQLNQFQTMLTQIGTSSSLFESTNAAAEAKLKTAVANQLNARMAAMRARMASTASGVAGNINAATQTASDSADKLTESQRILSGNYQKTSADMNALLATMNGAGGSLAASAGSLQALLSSMTDKEIVDFRMKIGQLAVDSRKSESGLREYLAALIVNKTDGAKLDAESTFFSNQQALSAAINAATDEISRTKSLASEALLDNQVVRANTSKLFDDLLTAEVRLSSASELHTGILADLQKNITDWKSALVKRINDIQAEVAQGASKLPEFAEEKLKNITVLVSMNQDDLKQFLTQFQASLDKAKAIQDHFQDSQAGRIIAAMTGVSQAIVTASVRMASQVAQSDMSASEKAKALTTVLSELCESIDEANVDAGKDDAAIAARVRAMKNNANATLDDLAHQVNDMMNRLATDKLNKDIGLSKSMEEAVSSAGVGINASANAIELAQRAIHKAVETSSAGWANNNKQVYTLGGFLFSLSQESQQKLLFILQELQHGRLNMDQALALARQADIAQIKSASDVVAVLVGAMDGYDSTVESIFGTSYERLTAASANLSTKVDSMVGDLVTLASVLDYNATMLDHRVTRFSDISNDFINTTQTNVSDLESYIFDQQAQVTKAMAALGSLMDYSEHDVALRQQQFGNWIDSLIANETAVINNKTAALKSALLGSSTPIVGSFVQRDEPKRVAERNVEVLKSEMKELDRRRHLRTPSQHQLAL